MIIKVDVPANMYKKVGLERAQEWVLEFKWMSDFRDRHITLHDVDLEVVENVLLALGVESNQ